MLHCVTGTHALTLCNSKRVLLMMAALAVMRRSLHGKRILGMGHAHAAGCRLSGAFSTAASHNAIQLVRVTQVDVFIVHVNLHLQSKLAVTYARDTQNEVWTGYSSLRTFQDLLISS
jgi:hypothetical protein